MLVRIWHGRTSRSKGDEYARLLAERAIPVYRSVAGNRGAEFLRRDDGEVSHFLTVTRWSSPESARSFAGGESLAAKDSPEDGDFLLDLEPEVQHFEQVTAASGSSAWLLVVAAFGLVVPNGLFIYWLFFELTDLASVLANHLALAFMIDAAMVVAVLTWSFAVSPLGPVRWPWFVGLSLLGGLGFGIPFFIWLNRRAERVGRRAR